jgi:hypothetical protein
LQLTHFGYGFGISGSTDDMMAPGQALAMAFGAGLAVGLSLFALTAWITWRAMQTGIGYWLTVPVIGMALMIPLWIWMLISHRRALRRSKVDTLCH